MVIWLDKDCLQRKHVQNSKDIRFNKQLHITLIFFKTINMCVSACNRCGKRVYCEILGAWNSVDMLKRSCGGVEAPEDCPEVDFALPESDLSACISCFFTCLSRFVCWPKLKFVLRKLDIWLDNVFFWERKDWLVCFLK